VSSAKHRKSRHRAPASSARSRHRKPSPVTAALQNKPVQVAAAAAGVALVAAAVGPAVASAGHGSGLGTASALHPVTSSSGSVAATKSPGGSQPQGSSHTTAQRDTRKVLAERAAAKKAAARRRKTAAAAALAADYQNPVRDIGGIILERIDQGVDFGGAGPIYAIGPAVITNASGDSGGWPGGGWITYEFTSGPAKGEQVYVAEDVRPTVTVGEHVTSATVIANMFNGGDGIETGWAQPSGDSAESQLPEAGSVNGAGPFPTDVGTNFDQLLHAVGVPYAPNYGQAPSGALPSRYPTDWATLLEAHA
jgi:hypothetical protein